MLSTNKLSNAVFSYLYGLMNSKQNTPDGEWVAVYQEIGGNAVAPENYAGQKLIIKDSTYMVLSDKVDEGIIKTNGDKLDIYGTDGVNEGRHLNAIYRMVGGRLTICYNLHGTGYPKNFTTKEQASYFLAVFEKAG